MDAKIEGITERESHFFYFMLLHTNEGQKALEAWSGDSVNLDFISLYEVGYVPKDLSLLQNFMEKMGVRGDFVERYEALRGRIVIPIRGKGGEVLSFSTTFDLYTDNGVSLRCHFNNKENR